MKFVARWYSQYIGQKFKVSQVEYAQNLIKIHYNTRSFPEYNLQEMSFTAYKRDVAL